MAGFAEIIAAAERLDIDVTLFLNSLRTPFTDCVWRFFSNTWVFLPLYLIILFFLFQRLGWKKTLIAIIAIAVTLVACDQLGNLVKNSVCRLRPCHNHDVMAQGLNILEDYGGKYGFFSAHAANTMGFAVCSYKCFSWNRHITFRRYLFFMVLWSFLVGISRVFVGKHFLGDVLAGFVAGWIIAEAVSWIAGKIAAGISRR